LAEIVIDGSRVRTTQAFFAQFFDQAFGYLPDFGGRNLEALHDDLRELTQPMTVKWLHRGLSRKNLFGLLRSPDLPDKREYNVTPGMYPWVDSVPHWKSKACASCRLKKR
jgi:RNAse (barnase) inhibitor barstar